MHKGKNTYLLKNTIALSIGSIGSKLITFFLVPLYTNVMSVKEYGMVDLITIISILIIPLITLNIQEAVMRYSMDNKNDKNLVFSVGVAVMLLTLFLGIVSYPVLNIFELTKEYSIYICLYMLSYGFSQIIVCFIRGQGKIMEYSIINMLQVLLIAVLNILFLLIFKFGVKGYLCAYIISYSLIFLIGSIRINIVKYLLNYKLDNKLAKEMIKYSVVLIPNSLMWWVMNSLDRIMVTTMINLNANGIYAVSYKIPSIIITLTTIFNQAWMFSAVKEKDSIDKDIYTNKVYTVFYNSLFIFCIFLFLILKPLMYVYVGNSFFKSWIYMPPLILGTIFLSLGTFLSNEYTAHKDSIGFLKSSSIGAIVNLILNFLLIPLFGVLGAAIATCISYLAVFIFRLFDTRKYLKLDIFNYNRIIQFILILISTFIIYVNSSISYMIIGIIFIVELILTRESYISIIKKVIGGRKNALR